MPATCPKCGATFDPKKTRAHPGLLREVAEAEAGASPEERIDAAARVRCPNCHFEHVSSEVRFFGVLSATELRWLVVGLVGAMIVAALAIGVARAASLVAGSPNKAMERTGMDKVPAERAARASSSPRIHLSAAAHRPR